MRGEEVKIRHAKVNQLLRALNSVSLQIERL